MASGPACLLERGMATIASLFVTKLYRAALLERKPEAFTAELKAACLGLAADDRAGQAWCKVNGYKGYTSYGSLNDLAWRDPVFAALRKALDKHVAAFVATLDYELADKKVELDSLWVNILKPGGVHTGHIHPHSVISGTTYVDMPDGAAALRLEDPRLGLMMAQPTRVADAAPENRSFVTLDPATGEVLLWESWLRHEVPMHQGKSPRISVSFNYRWG
jgi:uncharacterized protein (TIGR02466 family)